MQRVLKCGFAVLAAGWLWQGQVEAQIRSVNIESTLAEEKAERQILHRLAQPIDSGIPAGQLGELVRFLRQGGIPCQLDERALDDAAISGDVSYAGTTGEIPLRSALQLILDQLDLQWTIRDHVLLITTPEEAESKLKTRVFNVTNLLPVRQLVDYRGAVVRGRDYDSLIETITSTIDPASWDQVGGPGAIEALEVHNQALLVIAQTDVVLLRIERVLWNLHRISSTPLYGPAHSQFNSVRSSVLPISQALPTGLSRLRRPTR